MSADETLCRVAAAAALIIVAPVAMAIAIVRLRSHAETIEEWQRERDEMAAIEAMWRHKEGDGQIPRRPSRRL
jgi:hypothetical protein